MPEIKPLIQNNLPQLADRNITNKNNAAPSDIGSSETQKPQNKPEAPKKQSNFIFRNVQLGGLFITLPLLLPSLLIQAENITKYGEIGKDGFVNFISKVIDVLTGPFRFGARKFFELEHDQDDVSSNKRSFFFSNIFKRISHPNFVKEISSFMFGVRRALFNFFPNTFITPSEEHDTNNPNNKQSSTGLARIFYAASNLSGPFRWLSSLTTLVLSIPSYFTGALSAYNGEQNIFKISKYFARISDLFTPITSNLSSLFSSSRALYDSSKGESLAVTFGRYNINFLNVFQGVVGGLLSIPGFFGAINQAKDLILEKLPNSNKYRISEYIGEVSSYFLPYLKSYGLFTKHSESFVKSYISDSLSKIINNSSRHMANILDGFYNSNSLIRKIASQFRPVDSNGDVIYRNSKEFNLESYSGVNVTKSGFSKRLFFNELHSLLHPIQSLIMLLPAAYTPISDPYISDNGKFSIRLIDRILGINSFILSIPNYLIYALSTRVPQVVLKYFELKQKRANSQGLDFNAYEDFTQFKQKIANSNIPGTAYLAQVLEQLPIDEFTFQSNATTNKILDKLEKQAQDQEPSNKGTELLETFRIGAKAMLARKGLFFAERDDKGYTAEEHSRMKVYQSLGTFKEGIGRIPVIGIFISPLVELLRSRYYVKPRKGLASGVPGLS